MFFDDKDDDSVRAIELHRAENGYVVREPWKNGRMWIFETMEQYLTWVRDNMKIC